MNEAATKQLREMLTLHNPAPVKDIILLRACDRVRDQLEMLAIFILAVDEKKIIRLGEGPFSYRLNPEGPWGVKDRAHDDIPAFAKAKVSQPSSSTVVAKHRKDGGDLDLSGYKFGVGATVTLETTTMETAMPKGVYDRTKRTGETLVPRSALDQRAVSVPVVDVIDALALVKKVPMQHECSDMLQRARTEQAELTRQAEEINQRLADLDVFIRVYIRVNESLSPPA